MIGTKVTLRVRMGAHDAHYAGELVDGARILALFGDVATELLIRLDGDEGLFRAYESVEFLAPVFSGDFIEASAELVTIGQTNRQMHFEARKVIANVRKRGVPLSAANILNEPIVVCRAVGTCVTPKEMQRTPRELYVPALPMGVPPQTPGVVVTPAPESESHALESTDAGELVLTASIMGAEVTRQQVPHPPMTPQQIADEAARCREAGASVLHLHVQRNEDSPTQAADYFAEVVSEIRKTTDCILQVSTDGVLGMPWLACKPEMATLSCGTTNFGDDVLIHTRPQMVDLAARLRASGTVATLECYEVGHVEEALALADRNILAEPLHFEFVMGVGISAREQHLRYLVSLVPQSATWAVAAVGRFQEPLTELAMRLGGHACIGRESSEGRAPLVARAAAYARSIGRVPVEPARARALLLSI